MTAWIFGKGTNFTEEILNDDQVMDKLCGSTVTRIERSDKSSPSVTDIQDMDSGDLVIASAMPLETAHMLVRKEIVVVVKSKHLDGSSDFFKYWVDRWVFRKHIASLGAGRPTC